MAESSGSNDGDSAGKKKLGSNPQAGGGMDNSMPGRMTPFARMKLQQQEKEAQLYLDFCEFAAMWLQPSGCVQKHMVVLYFREHYDNHKYKYSSSAEDIEIEDAFDRWNQEEGPKAEANEFGLYLGVQINTDHEREVRIQEQLERRKTQIKLIIAESKRTGVKPPLEILKEAMELGVIEVPKATLESMKAVSARPQRRVSIAAPEKHPRTRARSPDSPKRKKKSSSRLGKSMGDLDLKSAERKHKKSHKDKDRKSKDKDKDKDRKSSKSSSSRLHKSMGNLDYKSSSRKSDKEEKKEKKKKDEKEHKSSSRDKDDKKSSKDKDRKASKSSSSRLHKSMGNLDYKEKDRKSSSRDKDKDRKSSSKDKDKKSSSKDKEKEKERKSSSKEKEKEKKSSSRKSSRRNSAH